MIELRTIDTLGSADYGWLKAKYHFSFADYHDAHRVHWRCLRALNDDQFQPNSGVPLHSHENIEIITYIYQGELTHIDNLGHHCTLDAGQIQFLSAGAGIEHNEFNHGTSPTRFFQIWMMPKQQNCLPFWRTTAFPPAQPNPEFSILASGFLGDSAPLTLNADARLVAISLREKQSAQYHFDTPRHAYLIASKGDFILNGHTVRAHDGVAIQDEHCLKLSALTDCDILLIDLA